MKNFVLKISVLLLIVLPSVWALPARAAADVYLVYNTSEGKLIQKELKKNLPTDLEVKTYNTALMFIADYSGKQKAVAKLLSAKIVVFINDASQEIVESGIIFNYVKVAGGGEEDIKIILDKLKEVE